MADFSLRALARELAAVHGTVYPTVKDAEKTLRRAVAQLRSCADTASVTTGGFMIRRDGEGYIEFWVSPAVVWRDTVKQNWLSE